MAKATTVVGSLEDILNDPMFKDMEKPTVQEEPKLPPDDAPILPPEELPPVEEPRVLSPQTLAEMQMGRDTLAKHAAQRAPRGTDKG